MKLLIYAEGAKQITMVIDHRNQCQVAKFVSDSDRDLGDKMFNLLTKSAEDGPPEHNNTKAKRLRDDIWEFKVGPKQGAKLRVLYFRGNNDRIVCTNAFKKAQQKTPPAEINRAIRMLADYKTAQITGTLETVTIDQFENS